MQMASSVGYLCSVCIVVAIAHESHFLALRREITENHIPESIQNLQGQNKKNKKQKQKKPTNTQSGGTTRPESR